MVTRSSKRCAMLKGTKEMVRRTQARQRNYVRVWGSIVMIEDTPMYIT